MNTRISFILILFFYHISLLGQVSSNLVILDEISVDNLGIQTVEASFQTFESTVFAIGRIEEIPSNHSVLSSRIAGRITEINAFEGDFVSEGQILAKVESRQLGNPPPTISLKAPQKGLIVESHVRLGQPVEPDVELLDISDRSQMWAVAKIPENEAAQVKIGSTAHIHIPALGDRIIDATLYRFGVEADRLAGTIEGIFILDNAEGKLRPGMRAEFSIVLSTRPNVLAVPRESIQGDPSKRVIFVKDFDLPNAFLPSRVTLGEKNDQYIEILTGLFPGDEVVTKGSYSLAFASGGSGISLKEALDAAHGHEHNEDGSEITETSKAAANNQNQQNPSSNGTSLPLLIYAGLVTIVCVVMAQLLWKRK